MRAAETTNGLVNPKMGDAMNGTAEAKRRLIATSVGLVIVLLAGACTSGSEAGTSTTVATDADTEPQIGSGESSTLREIIDRGVLRVGTQLTFPNWGFRDENREPAGFDIDVANAMADALGVEIELIETELANRIPYLQSGRVDVLITVFAFTPERALSVAYSRPYGSLLSVWASRIDDDINSIEDLADKTVAVTRGVGSADLMMATAPAGTEFLELESPADTFLAAAQGQADAVAQGLDGVNAFIAENPEWEITGDPLEPSFPIGVGVRFEDTDLLNWVNTWLTIMENDGELDRLYMEWFNLERPSLP